MFFVYVGYKPVTLLIMALGFSASFGYLIARVIGIAIEGADNKQWIYLGTEVVLAVAHVYRLISQKPKTLDPVLLQCSTLPVRILLQLSMQ